MSYSAQQFGAAPTPVIGFSFSAWIALFPEFEATVSSTQATMYSQIAAGFVDLGSTGPLANNTPLMATIWNLVTAHIAQLFAGSAQVPASPLVGRVSDVAEGSVSFSVEMPESKSQLAGWYAQTKYGATAWGMMAQFRQAFYVPRVCAPLPPGFPFYPLNY